MKNEHIITARDFQNKGFCLSGSRRWFADHDLDFKDFLKNGISKAILIATNDAMADRLIELLEQDENPE